MNRGKLLMTVVLVTQAVSGFVLDWRGNHLLNPLWHPHARFHGALLLFLVSGVSAIGVWLLWRDSKEPEVAMRVAALISFSFWTPFFYITSLLPGATLWAGDPGKVPHIRRYVFYPNAAVAGAFIVLTVVAWYMSAARSRRANPAKVLE